MHNLFVLDYSKSHASSKFIPYFSEENRWETEQSYNNVSNITQLIYYLYVQVGFNITENTKY